MEQMKYRIKVEWIGEGEPTGEEALQQEYLDGIECDGFTLLLSKGRRACACCAHNMSITDMANCMSKEATLQVAGRVAEIIDKESRPSGADFLSLLAKGARDEE